ncbi:MAG: hypothetical protein K5867_09465 [Bacteroidales bacterium]|nr:hypothetical protein [Bacteroidales bacterium]
MNLNVPFSEINEIIDKKLIILPWSLVYKDQHTIQLKRKIRIPLTKDIDVSVERIDGSDIYLNVDSGAINKLLDIVKNLSFESLNMIELLDNRIILHLDKNKKIAHTMEQITLQEISFNEENAVVKFMPKL